MKETFFIFFVSLPAIYGKVIARTPSSYDAGVIDGENAPESGIPYQVSLRTKDGTHWCGGSILNERWILTAAHCLSEPTHLIAGSNYISKGGDKYGVTEKVRHEDASNSGIFIDVALMKVDKDIKFTDRVQPIKLPTEDTGADVNVRVSGWGVWKRENMTAPDILQMLNVTTLSVEQCKEAWKGVYHDKEICTLDAKGGSACFGDSGGPLVDGDRVVGIVSRGNGACEKEYPNLFVRVYSYLDWIKKKIENKQ